MYEIYARLRDSMGVTDYRVAKETGIAKSTLSDWQKGKCNIKTEKLQKLADYFDVPLEYMLTGEMPNYYTNEESAKSMMRIW